MFQPARQPAWRPNRSDTTRGCVKNRRLIRFDQQLVISIKFLYIYIVYIVSIYIFYIVYMFGCRVQYLQLKFPNSIRIVVQSIYLQYDKIRYDTIRYMLRAEREILARRCRRPLRALLKLSRAELSYYTSVSHSLPLCRTHTDVRSPRPVAWHRPRLICLLFCYETELCQGQIYMNTLSAGDVCLCIGADWPGECGVRSHCSALLTLSVLCK